MGATPAVDDRGIANAASDWIEKVLASPLGTDVTLPL